MPVYMMIVLVPFILYDMGWKDSCSPQLSYPERFLRSNFFKYSSLIASQTYNIYTNSVKNWIRTTGMVINSNLS